MGIIVSKLLDKFMPKESKRILMLGLDGAGKTTLLYKFKIGEVVQSVPTIGFNTETVEYKSIKFNVWDVGGQDKIRALWYHYYDNANGLIYVVDSSDKQRILVAKFELQKMLQSEQLRNAPLLVFANKQDQGIMSVAQISDELELNQLKRQWNIQGCCAITGDGIFDGLDWFVKCLKSQK